MSQLSDKINSYTHEMGIEFNQSYTLSPTFTGTNAPTVTPYLTLTGTAPTFESNVGPVGGAGSWKFTQTSGSTASSVRTNTTTVTSTWADGNWSSGIWIKFNSLPTGTGQHAIHALLPGNVAPGFSLFITGSSHATNPSKFASNLVSTTAWTGGFGPTIEVNRWYYVAQRKTTTSTTAQVWIDGTLILTGNNTSTGSSSFAQFGGSGTASVSFSYNLSNWYVGTAAQITSTEIAEIWTAGSGIGVTITETPATATALQTEPTLIVSGGNHTEVTTSILVNATMVDIFSVSAEYNFTHQETAVYNVTADIVEPQVDTNIGVSFSPLPMTASALMTEPYLSMPLTASALMVEPSNIYTNPSYFKLIKALNPIFYIHDGELNTPPTVNDGSETFGTIVFPAAITSVDGGIPMNYIGEGLSWYNSINTKTEEITVNATGTSGRTALQNMWTNGNFTTEFWYKRTVPTTYELDVNLYSDTFISLKFAKKSYLTESGGYGERFGIMLTIIGSVSSNEIFAYGYTQANILNLNQWNHFAIRSTKSAGSNPQLTLFLNGNAIGTTTYVASSEKISNGGASVIYRPIATGYMDQMAIYNYALSNSNILDNYSFIASFDPNPNLYVDPLESSALLPNANYLAISNINYPESPVTASGLIVQPSVIAQINNSISVDPMTASAQNTDVTVYWGWTIYATPIVAAAESKEGYFLNPTYYQYVEANIAPYRYVTFDAQDEYLDYGTDNDYSVVPVSIGGTIVSPEVGINGKSVKTTGNSYITDGVILKESEWNDSWGTGQNSYHSAFWFQRADDDMSTTGLRVLWNLNGYKDNQHVILYQYQGKLHMQFNNGSGTWIEQDTTNGIDLFDYERHFIVIEFDHSNVNNNTVRLYVDAVLKMTVSLGSYTGSTTNASSADSGPNNEANNHPRLSIGCLITPFVATALPVVPTNTKLIIDEIYWDKDSISSTMVVNLYNMMPDKNNANVVVLPMECSDELPMPMISTNSNLNVLSFDSSSELIDPILYIERFIINTADPMIASSLMTDAIAFQNADIISDIFLATTVFGGGQLLISVPGGPMLASAKLISKNDYFDPYHLLILQQGVKQFNTSFKVYSLGDIDS